MSAIERSDFLVEVGTEELPPKALTELEAAFASSIVSQLEQSGLKGRSLQTFSTPRRLAVRIRKLPIRQPDQQVKRRGPPMRAAFDTTGTATRAALAFAESCGVALDALGRFELLETVGHGAFGTVFKARDPRLDRTVALKVPRRDNIGPKEQDLERFLREVMILYIAPVSPQMMLSHIAEKKLGLPKSY